jgi:ribonucleoside-diphosphate reductase, alpha subunit
MKRFFVFSIGLIKDLCQEHQLVVDEDNLIKKFNQSRDLKEFCNSIVDDVLHPDNEKLAVLLLLRQHHIQMGVKTNDSIDAFLSTMETLYYAGVISDLFLDKIVTNKEAIDTIHHGNDFNFSYQAIIMLMQGYLCKIKKDVLECPQYMYLRVAFQLHDDHKLISQTYRLLSNKLITHASPTLFNSGTRCPQLSSCFLVCLKDDSVSGIYKTLSECANISKYGGGIGVSLSDLRSKYSYIKSSQNPCKGVKPVLEELEHCARYIDQGGRRKGAICVYFEMTHPEIPDVLSMKRNTSRNSSYEHKLRDLFLGLWIPDLFMERVKSNGKWSFFDELHQRTLTNLYGDEYVQKFLELEEQKEFVNQVDARSFFNEILETQTETGMPFMCYKDTANILSNQQNVGIIQSSNLCTEIFEVSSEHETAVCNLASINLEKCVGKNGVDYELIGELTAILTRNLNNTIDNNFYCSEDAKRSNLSLRPIGIGVTGLQGLFFDLEISLTSTEAREINSRIFEVMYYNALLESNKIAKERTSLIVRRLSTFPYIKGFVKKYMGCYSRFWGSPLSQGKTHIELYEELTDRKIKRFIPEEKWDSLKKDIMSYGVANSQLIALMPTASTAELMEVTDCFEPITGAIVSKNTQHGNFKVVNKHIRNKLMGKGCWTQETIDSIIQHNGSVQQLDCLNDGEKEVYRTAWEIDPVDYINLAIDRAPFIDQSQSLSWFIEDPGKDFNKLGHLHFYTWENKLKTGMYYLRQIPASQNLKFKKMEEDMKNSCVACT